MMELSLWFENQKEKARDAKRKKDGVKNHAFRSAGKKIGHAVSAFGTK
jgi:hypothetical protein